MGDSVMRAYADRDRQKHPQWNDELHAELTCAVATVLARHGLLPDGAAEDEWWTVEQVQEHAELLRKHVDDIARRHFRKGHFPVIGVPHIWSPPA